MAGRILAVGDIHGCHAALETLLGALVLQRDDTLVVLGDVVDRGSGSRQVVDQLLQLQDQCRLVFIKGNHEEMMLESLVNEEMKSGWLYYGGRATLNSYGGDPSQIPRQHLEFLDSGLDYWETDREIFLHANVTPLLPLTEQDVEILRWTHLTGYESPHPSGKRIVCGHTAQRSGAPLVVPGWVCIDTFACGGGWLTALDVTTDEIVQANQQGETRRGQLDSAAAATEEENL